MTTRIRRIIALTLLASLWAASFAFILPLGQDVYRGIAAPAHGQTVQISGPCDFVMFYAVGRMAAAGAAADVYNAGKTIAWEASNKANLKLQIAWLYPPTGLILPRLVQALPFFQAFFVWNAALISVSLFVLRCAALPWPVIAVALVSPAALLNVDLGQLGFLTGSLFFASMVLGDRKPALSGILGGVMILKPQAAMVLPILFLARKRWTGATVGAVTAITICIFSVLLFGPEIWQRFLSQGLPVSHAIVVQPFPRTPPPVANSNEFYGISVFWMFRSFGCGISTSYVMQAIASVGALVVCWCAWRLENTNRFALYALTACLAVIALPYGYLYDLTAVSIAFAALAYDERRLMIIDVVLWTWPVTALIIAFNFFIEVTPIVLCIASYRAARALRGVSRPPVIPAVRGIVRVPAG
jgi:hypothetical protein